MKLKKTERRAIWDQRRTFRVVHSLSPKKLPCPHPLDQWVSNLKNCVSSSGGPGKTDCWILSLGFLIQMSRRAWDSAQLTSFQVRLLHRSDPHHCPALSGSSQPWIPTTLIQYSWVSEFCRWNAELFASIWLALLHLERRWQEERKQAELQTPESETPELRSSNQFYQSFQWVWCRL